jgi:hypothetical protein
VYPRPPPPREAFSMKLTIPESAGFDESKSALAPMIRVRSSEADVQDRRKIRSRDIVAGRNAGSSKPDCLAVLKERRCLSRGDIASPFARASRSPATSNRSCSDAQKVVRPLSSSIAFLKRNSSSSSTCERNPDARR